MHHWLMVINATCFSLSLLFASRTQPYLKLLINFAFSQPCADAGRARFAVCGRFSLIWRIQMPLGESWSGRASDSIAKKDASWENNSWAAAHGTRDAWASFKLSVEQIGLKQKALLYGEDKWKTWCLPPNILLSSDSKIVCVEKI